MWIGEFSKRAGLPIGTVRFYARAGLLKPAIGSAGGSRPYLEFSPRDLRVVASIRAGQALGIPLEEIRQLMDDRRGGGGATKLLATLTERRGRLVQRAADLTALIAFVDAKIAWLHGGRVGSPPEPPLTSPDPEASLRIGRRDAASKANRGATAAKSSRAPR